MFTEISKRRFDDQLNAILDERGNWKVNGSRDMVLCEANSLRDAIDKAVEITARGREVVALVRRARPEIIVFASQFQRLANRIAESEYYPGALRA